jgi:uncharacterized protein (TIGR02246 family)
MHSRYSWAAAFALAVILAGCNEAPKPAADTREADAKAIRNLETAWNQAYASKDVDQIIAFYADDASVFVPDSPQLNGVEAIKPALNSLVKDKNFTLSFESNKVEVAKSGGIGYSQGAYTSTMTDRKTKKVLTEKGKYVTVYKKQVDGKWKAVADIWNEDASPRPQASSKSSQKVLHHKRARR